MRIRIASKYTLKILLCLCIFCAASVGAAYVWRCVLTEMALTAWFAETGFIQATFTVSDVSQEGISVHEFDGCMQRESFCAKAKKIDVRFRSILRWDSPQESLAIEGGVLRLFSQSTSARNEPYDYLASLHNLTLYPYLSYFDKIAFTGQIFFKDSQNKQVNIEAESQCGENSCRAEVGLSHVMSPITVRISASEEQEKGVSLIARAFNHEHVLGAVSLKRDIDTWVFGIETHQQGVFQLAEFIKKITPSETTTAQQFEEQQEEAVKAVLDSISLQVRIDPTAVNHPLEISVEKYPIPSGGTVSLSGAGTVSSAGVCALKGEVSVPDLGAIAVERFTITPVGDFAVTASLKDKAQRLNNIYSKIALGKLFDDLVGGEVALTYTATGKLPIQSPFTLQGEGTFHVSALQGRFKGYDVRGGSTSGQIHHGLQNLEIRHWKLNLEALRAGIEIDGVEAELPVLRYEFGLERTPGRYSGKLSRIAGSVFGGQLSAGDIEFSQQKKNYSFPVVLNGIDLKELLSLYGNGYATASGIIDGTLPVQINKNGVSIQAGKLAARAPGGDISIGEDLIAKLRRTPGMEVAANALRNYHFTELESDVEYKPDGQLELRLALKGKSPELNTSRPVHVNLTLEQNVLELLKSLQMVNTIEEKFGH